MSARNLTASDEPRHAEAIKEARARLVGRIVHTPAQEIRPGLFLKREDLQVSRSFKMRGAANALLATSGSPRPTGVVCASSGNTGKALAMLTQDAVVFVPLAANKLKVRALEDLGAQVVCAPGNFSEVSTAARKFAMDHRHRYISSASDWNFIYGNATLGVELLEQCRGLTMVLVPIGGGGLAAGIGLALSVLPRATRPRLIGVELATSCPVYRQLRSTCPPVRYVPSVADCLDGDLESEAVILEVATKVLDDVVLVSDGQLLRAQAELARLEVLVGPGPAAAFAGYRSMTGRLPEGGAAIVISGYS